MGLSCFRAISGWMGLGWDLCAGLFYEHRFAMLISVTLFNAIGFILYVIDTMYQSFLNGVYS